MRIKFLSVIVSFLVISFAVTSCLNTDDNYEYSPDDVITAFTLDTIYGVTYKFTIDQVGVETDENGRGIGRIFNVDSVPFSADTIINKILIKTVTTNGYIASGETAEKDTLFYNLTTDSLDLSKTMTEPLVLRVRSYAHPDKPKQYKIYLNIHKQDPDTLIWHKMPEAYPVEIAGSKVDTLGNNLLSFPSHNKVYIRGLANGELWKENSINSLPADTKLSSILNYRNSFYVISESGKAFSSANGIDWLELSSNKTIVDLLTPFPDFIAGVVQEESGKAFAAAALSTDGKTLTWSVGAQVPADFPVENISTTHSFQTNTGLMRALILGKSTDDKAEKITPWATHDGKTWGKMETTSTYCIPAMEKPSIIFYGKMYYAFGGNFEAFYASENGITWKMVEKKFLFPAEFKDKTHHSVVVDKNKYIWIIWKDGVWKGRQNKLGFIIQ